MLTIKREKVWVDTKIVSGSYRHGSNHVEYYLWNEDKRFDGSDPEKTLSELKKEKIQSRTSICFGGTLNTISGSRNSKKPYNRMLYVMTEDKSATVKLTKEEKRDWIALSKKNKMLPRYMPVHDLEYYKKSSIPMVLPLGENSVVALLYVYLSQLRYLREYPGYVRSVLHLHQEHDIDFVAAFVAASMVSVDYTVHHYLSYYRRYGQNPDINKEQNIPLHVIAGLKRFLRDPGKYDTRKLYSTHNYRGADTVERVSKVQRKLSLQELKEPLIRKAFCALTEENMKKYLTQYDALKKKIKYVEAGK